MHAQGAVCLVSIAVWSRARRLKKKATPLYSMPKLCRLNSSTLESLSELFLWWYGKHKPVITPIARAFGGKSDCAYGELPNGCLDDAWRNRWFAKGNLTTVVDKLVDTRWRSTIDTVAAEPMPSDMPLWERLARIILLDQLPRNIYRGTPRAYSYDSIALPLALSIAEDEEAIAALPLHFQATIFICLCHSEQKVHQELLATRLHSKAFEKYRHGNSANITAALEEILRKHAERVDLFGRFPERNDALGRVSTEQERSFLGECK
jgi:uncharacterized protein (DUF924 family)